MLKFNMNCNYNCNYKPIRFIHKSQCKLMPTILNAIQQLRFIHKLQCKPCPLYLMLQLLPQYKCQHRFPTARNKIRICVNVCFICCLTSTINALNLNM